MLVIECKNANGRGDPKRTRGLVWHTQGSGKTITTIKMAERLFRAHDAQQMGLMHDQRPSEL